ncbi:DUF3240 family protein [Peristeroidobacter agariperforans]|uniref:DUF3240 family protein n=1 Tax=Peristeroidobacter agariperforans TaxID=268404 RepID=UPI00101C2CED|nr:DUF3240 family protein [Peristeroidobacter agariperforans]
MTAFVRLTLVFPPAIEAALIETLITAPQAPAFTLVHAQGHGNDFPHASTAEQVRGSVDRRIVWIVLESVALQPLIESIRARVRSHDVVWWSEPVLELGRLA